MNKKAEGGMKDEQTEERQKGLKAFVMNAFVVPFKGLSFQDIKGMMPYGATDESIKQAIGALIADHQLEYVDFRCYKVYPSYFDYFTKQLETLSPIKREIIKRRFSGETLESVSKSFGLTRERVRQIYEKTIKRINSSIRVECSLDTGSSVFDEDFYEVLYTKCDLPSAFWSDELGLSKDSTRYLANPYKKGSKTPESILADEDIPVSLAEQYNKLAVLLH